MNGASTLRVRRTRSDAKRFSVSQWAKMPPFWALARAMQPFAGMTTWPAIEDYVRAFGDAEPVVRFVAAPPRARGRDGAPIDPCRMYDGRIVHSREVMTREAHWHDFVNALVWATFPKAKLALHARQHRAIVRRAKPGMTTLPNARTREQDALALIDEGGVIRLASEDLSKPTTIVFGHALYEGMILEHRSMRPRTIELRCRDLPRDDEPLWVARADEALATWIGEAGADLSPATLGRLR